MLCSNSIFGFTHRRARALPLLLLAERREPSGLTLNFQWEQSTRFLNETTGRSLANGMAQDDRFNSLQVGHSLRIPMCNVQSLDPRFAFHLQRL